MNPDIQSNKVIRWGILGCGKIARKFAGDLPLAEGTELHAVASRDGALAQRFGGEFGARRSFDNYEALVSCAEVDVIYIATPHGLHYEHVMLCLDHGKAVLCEKAFALTRWQAEAMVARAREKKVFLMEAFWTKFLPQYKKVRELIDAGTIGEVKLIQADFGFSAEEPVAQRLYDPALGGGSLLDVGIYPVFLAQAILGRPSAVAAMMTPHGTSDVDEQCCMLLQFQGGALASLASSFLVHTPVEASINGTKGRLLLRNRFHNAIASVTIVYGKDDAHTIEIERETGYGYQYEARHVSECLRQGLTESPVMTHADSLLLLETLDRLRAACGIRYAADRS